MGPIRGIAALAAAVVTGGLIAAPLARAQGPSPCPEVDLVQYAEVRQVLRDRTQIEVGTEFAGRLPVHGRFEEIRSPHRTAHALLSSPDFAQQGPWTSVVAVRGNEARPLDLLITFRDHGSSKVRVRWLNEKLMWFRVWWGRVVASELVLNVETGELLYLEEADFRLLLLSCEEKRRLLEESRQSPSPTPSAAGGR